MIKKQDYNPSKITKKEILKNFKNLSRDIGRHIADAYVICAIENAWASGYNSAIDDMERCKKRKKKNVFSK